MTENLTLLKLLADETRLRIINILAEGDSYVELIATKLELTPATVCYHLKKMEAAGMVNCSRAQFYIIYSLNGDIFDRPLRDLLITGDNNVCKGQPILAFSATCTGSRRVGLYGHVSCWDAFWLVHEQRLGGEREAEKLITVLRCSSAYIAVRIP